jgi:hypothetical protein
VGKPEGKRTLRKPRRRYWTVKIDLREIGWDDMDWIDLAQVRDQWRALVNTIINLRVQKYWVFGFCPSSGILEARKHKFRKLDLFPSSDEGVGRHLLSWVP